MSDAIKEALPFVAMGLLTMWALWFNLKLAIGIVRLVSRGTLREAWVNGLRASPPFVRVPRRAKHCRRQMACGIGGTIIPVGVNIKGVGWTDRLGRGWFVPDADYVGQHGYSFNYAMSTATRTKGQESRETQRLPPAPRPGKAAQDY